MPKSGASNHPAPHLAGERKPGQWRAFLAIAKYATIAAVRNPATLAFGFIFPLVFITAFGLLGNSETEVRLGVSHDVSDDNPILAVVEQIEIVTVERGSNQELDEQLVAGELDAVMQVESPTENEAQFAVQLVTSGGNPAGEAAASSVIRGVVDQVSLKLSGVESPPVTFEQHQVGGRQNRYIDFALPGMIGFSLLSTAIFSTVFGFIALKRMLVLKRMFATPTKPLTILTAQGASRLVFALAQTMLIVAVGVLAFDFFLPHGWVTFAEIVALTIFGLIAFLGFGYFMAGLANDENSAGPLVNLITLPQFLLSGVFFPTDTFPSWVQPIADNLPLSYFNTAIRHITTEGGTLVETWPYLLGLTLWGGAMYLLAAKTFRWE